METEKTETAQELLPQGHVCSTPTDLRACRLLTVSLQILGKRAEQEPNLLRPSRWGLAERWNECNF